MATVADVFEQIPGGIVVFDHEGRALLQNSSCRQILGAAVTDVQDLRFITLDGGEPDQGEAAPARALAGTVVVSEDLQVSTATGFRRVRVTALPIWSGAHAPAGAAVLLIDASGRGADDAAGHGHGLGALAHDLRNRVAAIHIAAQLLTKPDEIASERRIALASRILSGTRRMEAALALLPGAKPSGAGLPAG